jgi:hypothetical protein
MRLVIKFSEIQTKDKYLIIRTSVNHTIKTNNIN